MNTLDRPDDPIHRLNVNIRHSHLDLLKARAVRNDTNVSAEMRRILREETEREALARGAKAA